MKKSNFLYTFPFLNVKNANHCFVPFQPVRNFILKICIPIPKMLYFCTRPGNTFISCDKIKTIQRKIRYFYCFMFVGVPGKVTNLFCKTAWENVSVTIWIESCIIKRYQTLNEKSQYTWIPIIKNNKSKH